MVQTASALERLIYDALRSSKNLAKEPADFLSQRLSSEDAASDAFRRAALAVYCSLYYSLVRRRIFDHKLQRTLTHLARLLSLADDDIERSRRHVGLAVYKRLFREVTKSGRVSASDQAELDTVQEHFKLHKRDLLKANASQALTYFTFALTEALKDGVVSETELVDLGVIARKYGLSHEQRRGISVPEKKEVLRAALANIKAKGEITDTDREYMRTLVEYLNANEFLKPCMMDLELYSRIFAIRRGQLPVCDPGDLLIDAGERLHFAGGVIYEHIASGGKAKSQKGMLYVGTAKIRFVGVKRSHEVRYKNILQLEFQPLKTPRIQIHVSSGAGGGGYRLARANNPGALIELEEILLFLRKKAMRLLEPRARTGFKTALN